MSPHIFVRSIVPSLSSCSRLQPSKTCVILDGHIVLDVGSSAVVRRGDLARPSLASPAAYTRTTRPANYAFPQSVYSVRSSGSRLCDNSRLDPPLPISASSPTSFARTVSRDCRAPSPLCRLCRSKHHRLSDEHIRYIHLGTTATWRQKAERNLHEKSLCQL